MEATKTQTIKTTKKTKAKTKTQPFQTPKPKPTKTLNKTKPTTKTKTKKTKSKTNDLQNSNEENKENLNNEENKENLNNKANNLNNEEANEVNDKIENKEEKGNLQNNQDDQNQDKTKEESKQENKSMLPTYKTYSKDSSNVKKYQESVIKKSISDGTKDSSEKISISIDNDKVHNIIDKNVSLNVNGGNQNTTSQTVQTTQNNQDQANQEEKTNQPAQADPNNLQNSNEEANENKIETTQNNQSQDKTKEESKQENIIETNENKEEKGNLQTTTDQTVPNDLQNSNEENKESKANGQNKGNNTEVQNKLNKNNSNEKKEVKIKENKKVINLGKKEKLAQNIKKANKKSIKNTSKAKIEKIQAKQDWEKLADELKIIQGNDRSEFNKLYDKISVKINAASFFDDKNQKDSIKADAMKKIDNLLLFYAEKFDKEGNKNDVSKIEYISNKVRDSGLFDKLEDFQKYNNNVKNSTDITKPEKKKLNDVLNEFIKKERNKYEPKQTIKTKIKKSNVPVNSVGVNTGSIQSKINKDKLENTAKEILKVNAEQKKMEELKKKQELEKQKQEAFEKKKQEEELLKKQELEKQKMEELKKKQENERKEALKQQAEAEINNLLEMTEGAFVVADGKDLKEEISNAVDKKGCKDMNDIYRVLLPDHDVGSKKKPTIKVDAKKAKKLDTVLQIISKIQKEGLTAVDGNISDVNKKIQVLLSSGEIYNAVTLKDDKTYNKWPSYEDIMNNQILKKDAKNYKKITSQNLTKQEAENTKEFICNIINEYNEKKNLVKKKKMSNNIAKDHVNYGNTFSNFSNKYNKGTKKQQNNTFVQNGKNIVMNMTFGNNGNNSYLPKNAKKNAIKTIS